MSKLSSAGKLAGGSMVVVAISAFLPWYSIFGINVSGIEGDGVITLFCALVGLVVLALSAGVLGGFKLNRKAGLIVSGVLAVITTLVGLVDMNGVAAIGLYLTLLAGVAWIIGVIWEIRLGRATAFKEGEAGPSKVVGPSGHAGA